MFDYGTNLTFNVLRILCSVWILNLCCRFQVKYLGEEGENTPLAGAASICSTWDLVVSLLKFSCIKFSYLISFSHALSSMYYILCFELVYCNIMLENFSFQLLSSCSMNFHFSFIAMDRIFCSRIKSWGPN